MQRWLVVFALLFFMPSVVWAETCTFDVGDGTIDWATIGQDIDAAGCTEDSTDSFVIPTGVEVTVTATIASPIAFHADDANTGSITIQDGGTLIIASGTGIDIGGGGITVDSGGTFTMSGLVLDAPTDATPTFNAANTDPDAMTDWVQLGDIVHCPGDTAGTIASDCNGDEGTNVGLTNEIAICYPDARYEDSVGTVEGKRYYEEYIAATALGDVVTFWDPYPERLGPKPRDINSSYEIVDVQHKDSTSSCVYASVYQGGRDNYDDGYDLTQRALGIATITADLKRGDRYISTKDLDSTVDAVATDDERKARYLTCPDETIPASAYGHPGAIAGIIDTDDEGTDADNDLLTLDTHGLRAPINVPGPIQHTATGFDFVDGGGGSDTITRPDGSFVTDGFVVGQTLTVSNATNGANNGAYVLTGVAALTLTVATASVTADTTDTGALLTGSVDCFVDYGWARGDSYFIWRPAILRSATDDANQSGGTASSRRDSPLTCASGSICTFNLAVFDSLGNVILNDATSSHDVWFRDTDGPSGKKVQFVATDKTYTRWQFTGAAPETTNSHGFQYNTANNVNIVDNSARHSDDDFFLTGDGDGANGLHFLRVRCGFSNDAVTNSQNCYSDTSGDVNVTVTDMLCEDCMQGEQLISASGVIGHHVDADPIRVTNATVIAVDTMLAAGGAPGTGEIYFDNTYLLGYEGAVSALGRITDLRRFSVVDAHINTGSLSWGSTSQGPDVYRDGIFKDVSVAANVAVFIAKNSAAYSLENVAFVDLWTEHAGTTNMLFQPGDSASASLLTPFTNVSFIETGFSKGGAYPGTQQAGSSLEYIIEVNKLDEGDNFLTFTGLMIAGFRDGADDAASAPTAIRNTTTTPAFNETDSTGMCFFDNGLDFNTQIDEDIVAGTAFRDEAPGFVDLAGGDWRLQKGSLGYTRNCGAIYAPGAAPMWGLSVRHIDPFATGDSHFNPVLHTDGGGAY